MAIDFPNSPSSGDIHTVSGKQWSWDGEKWLAYGASLSPGILKIDTGNNRVGINQVAPTVALDVTGSARITGDLTVSGTTVTVDSATVLIKDRISFEGATADGYETVLVATDPTGSDKTITLPNATGTVTLDGAPLASPTFTGVPAAPTASANTSSTQVATTAFVMTEVGDYAPLASPTLTGVPAAPTAAANTSTTQLATTAFVMTEVGDYAPLASPTLTGTPAAPTASANTSTTQVATTAFVMTEVGDYLPLAGGTLSGAIVAADQIVSGAVLKDYSETVHAGGNTGSTETLDETDGNLQTWTLDANCTFTMPSGSGLKAGTSLTLVLTQDGTGSRTATFTGVKWAGGEAIEASTGAADIDIVTFITYNGGSSPVWYGAVSGLDFTT